MASRCFERGVGCVRACVCVCVWGGEKGRPNTCRDENTTERREKKLAHTLRLRSGHQIFCNRSRSTRVRSCRAVSPPKTFCRNGRQSYGPPFGSICVLETRRDCTAALPSTTQTTAGRAANEASELASNMGSSKHWQVEARGRLGAREGGRERRREGSESCKRRKRFS